MIMFNRNDVWNYRHLFATVEGYFNYEYEKWDNLNCIKYFELVHSPTMNMQFFAPEGSPFFIERNFRILRFYKNDS